VSLERLSVFKKNRTAGGQRDSLSKASKVIFTLIGSRLPSQLDLLDHSPISSDNDLCADTRCGLVGSSESIRRLGKSLLCGDHCSIGRFDNCYRGARSVDDCSGRLNNSYHCDGDSCNGVCRCGDDRGGRSGDCRSGRYDGCGGCYSAFYGAFFDACGGAYQSGNHHALQCSGRVCPDAHCRVRKRWLGLQQLP
jgi:hypothetical protein